MDFPHSESFYLQGKDAKEFMRNKFPIHYACKVNNRELLTRTVQSGKTTLQDFQVEDPHFNWAPIHWASYYGNVEILEGLVKLGVSVNTQTSDHKLTPLYLSMYARSNKEVLVKTLVCKLKADLNVQDVDGNTVLHKAVESRNLNLIKFFMSKKPNVQLQNYQGLNAFDFARLRGFDEILNILSQHYNISNTPLRLGSSGNIQKRSYTNSAQLQNETICKKLRLNEETPMSLPAQQTDNKEEFSSSWVDEEENYANKLISHYSYF